MTVTTIDPKPALVVIDLQKGVVGYPTVHPVADVLAATGRLLKAFRSAGLPVVLVNATGRAPGRVEISRAARERPPDWAELVAELDPQPSDIRISKQTWGAFHRTPLDEKLRGVGVTQIILAGIATSMGVESSARAAYEHGYNVVLAVDAMTDVDPELHRNSVERVFPRLGETATSEEIAALIQRGA